MIARWFSAKCSSFRRTSASTTSRAMGLNRPGSLGETGPECLIDHRLSAVLRQQGGVPGQHPQVQEVLIGLVGVGRVAVGLDELVQHVGHLLPPGRLVDDPGCRVGPSDPAAV